MRRAAAAAALLVVLVLASCGGSDPEPVKPPVVIGTLNFTESEILGELYKQALEAKGLRVELRSGVGPRELTHRALVDGDLDMYPEYIGVLLSVIHGVVERPESPAEAYALAKRLEGPDGFELLEPTRLSNDNALAVRKSFGERRGVSSIADLDKLRPDERIGAAPEFRNRFEGLVGLRKLYGLKSLRMKPVDISKGEQYTQIDSGKIDVALVFTTDSQLAGDRYTVLSDPKGVFAVNHVAPLISAKTLTAQGPLLAQTLNAVSALLTTPVMRELNAKATARAPQTPKQIAAEFLRANALN